MALIVEGTTSKDITTAKPKAVATKPTTTKVTTFFDPYKASGQTKKVPTTVTTPAKTTTTTQAPKPVATPSKSTGGVKSTTMTPTAATKAAVPNITPTKPSATAIAQGVKENLAKKTAPSAIASELGIAKTAQTNILTPTVGGVAGGLSAIQGQDVLPQGVPMGTTYPQAVVNPELSTPTEQPVTTFFDPYEASRQAQEALQAKAKAEEEAAKRAQLEQVSDRINMPTPSAGLSVDTASGLAMVGGTPNALGMPSDFGMMTGNPYFDQLMQMKFDYDPAKDPATGMALSGVPSAVGMFGSATGNPYFDQLMSMKFDYDPAKDPEYINGSKVLENQVAQMMVGRGGLYSSVNQAALFAKLIEFQLALRKQKYEQYTQDRSFMLQMANTIWDRQDAAFNQYMTVAKYNADREDAMFSRMLQMANTIWDRQDAAFNQNMAIAKYNADREDAMFSRQMQQEQLNLSRASQALAQARYKMEVDAANKANTLNGMVAQVKYDQAQYKTLFNEWSKSGSAGASNRVAAFFGVNPGTLFNYNAQKYTVARAQELDALINQTTMLARDLNEFDIMQAGLQGFVEQEVVPKTEYKYTSTTDELGQTTLRTEWSEYK